MLLYLLLCVSSELNSSYPLKTPRLCVPLLYLPTSSAWHAPSKFMGSHLPPNQAVCAAENDHVLHSSWWITAKVHFLDPKILEICIQFCLQTAWRNQIHSYLEVEQAGDNRSSHHRKFEVYLARRKRIQALLQKLAVNLIKNIPSNIWWGSYSFLSSSSN